jgi:capsular exopolysaccharide synthesis family protein
MIAVAAAVVSDLLDNTVRDPEQVARCLNTQVIGSLPSVKNWKRHLPGIGSSHATTALVKAEGVRDEFLTNYGESIRTLRNSILLTDFDRNIRSLLVTSAVPGEGKSTTAANLAIAHSEQGLKTLLIDGDLRRPSVGKRFDLKGSTGLSNVLMSEISWRDAVVKADAGKSLDILPSGPPSRRAADLIGRGLFEILAEASSEYDLIILDGPPLLGFAEPLQMATSVDGVLVVTRAGETSRKAVGSVLSLLTRLRVHVVGLVLNGVHKDLSDTYQYYGYYGKYYQGERKAS